MPLRQAQGPPFDRLIQAQGPPSKSSFDRIRYLSINTNYPYINRSIYILFLVTLTDSPVLSG